MKHSVVFSFIIFFYSMSFSQVDESVIDGEKNETATVSISGNIFMGSLSLKEGMVFLLNSNKELNSTVNTSELFEGRFEFNDIEKSNYSIYVIPTQSYDFFYFPKYLPTYLGGSFKWEDALQIELKQEQYVFNINLNSYKTPFYGHAKISGKINLSERASLNREIPISVLLLNKDRVPMDFRLVEQGNEMFLFDKLPEGKYFIHPEIPGYRTEDFEINIKASSSNNIDFDVDNDSIKKGLSSNKKLKPIITKNQLKLFVTTENDSPVVCGLIDITGKLILKKIYLGNEIIINTSGLSTGIYILQVKTYGNTFLKTVKVYINNN